MTNEQQFIDLRIRNSAGRLLAFGKAYFSISIIGGCVFMLIQGYNNQMSVYPYLGASAVIFLGWGAFEIFNYFSLQLRSKLNGSIPEPSGDSAE